MKAVVGIFLFIISLPFTFVGGFIVGGIGVYMIISWFVEATEGNRIKEAEQEVGKMYRALQVQAEQEEAHRQEQITLAHQAIDRSLLLAEITPEQAAQARAAIGN